MRSAASSSNAGKSHASTNMERTGRWCSSFAHSAWNAACDGDGNGSDSDSRGGSAPYCGPCLARRSGGARRRRCRRTRAQRWLWWRPDAMAPCATPPRPTAVARCPSVLFGALASAGKAPKTFLKLQMATACIHYRRHRDNASSLPSAASSTSSSSSWPPRRRRRRRPRAVDPLSLRVAARRRQRRPAGRGAFCARDPRRHPAAACHAAVPAHGALPTLRAKNSVPPAHLARRQALPWRRAPRAHAAGAAVSRAAASVLRELVEQLVADGNVRRECMAHNLVAPFVHARASLHDSTRRTFL
ncbi:hypothetical protein FGB62_251g05 [Gracilaria domingensis]|nr:hypothetical protein FGB62_251g05 [Gracilaria domingensis]